MVTAGSEKPAAGEILITLSDEGTSCDSDAVRVEGGTVTVTAEGTYRLSGTLSDGQIVVSAPEDAKVRLILDGAEITKTGSAAICALSADKLILSSAAGSVNRLASAGDFAQTDGDNTDAAVFAKCDLSLGGDGTILVSCETGHGLVSKDDLKVRGGTVSVTAAKKGLEGKDSLTVEGGTLLIDAGTKGLVSSNDESDEVGVIEILDGNLTVRSGDDSVHAAGRVQIAGGTLTLSSGDDGIHAGNRIEVSGGSITVLESYEGLEAQVIEVSGGEIDVTASDDGFNAAGGSDGSNGFGRFGGDPLPERRERLDHDLRRQRPCGRGRRRAGLQRQFERLRRRHHRQRPHHLLAGRDGVDGKARAGVHVAADEDIALAALVGEGVGLDGPLLRRDRMAEIERAEIDLLADRADDGIDLDRLEFPGADGLAAALFVGLAERHDLHLESGDFAVFAEDLDGGVEEAELHALLHGLFGFLGVGGHLGLRTAVDDICFLRAEAHG